MAVPAGGVPKDGGGPEIPNWSGYQKAGLKRVVWRSIRRPARREGTGAAERKIEELLKIAVLYTL